MNCPWMDVNMKDRDINWYAMQPKIDRYTCRTRAPYRTLSWFATSSGAISMFKPARTTYNGWTSEEPPRTLYNKTEGLMPVSSNFNNTWQLYLLFHIESTEARFWVQLKMGWQTQHRLMSLPNHLNFEAISMQLPYLFSQISTLNIY